MVFGRDRLERVLALAGNPERSCPVVLIGGTNGKGSLVSALSCALSTRWQCGSFIKPHLVSIRERWRINDNDISEEQFSWAANMACDLIEQSGEEISFFEANVLMGALLFEEANCEIAIWEVGLGGTHDACNLLDPAISILTHVGLDHQAILGNTVEEIALDKAGIARKSKPFILGPCLTDNDAAYLRYEPVVRQAVQAIGARYIPLPMEQQPGDLQPAIMLAAGAELAKLGFGLDREELYAGISGMRHRGRNELTTLAGQPVLLDSAHNADALRMLAANIAREFGRPLPFVYSCQNTREPLEMLELINQVVSTLTPIEVPVLRPCPVGRIAAAAQQLGMPLTLPEGLDLSEIPQEYEVGHVTELDPPDNRTQWIESVQHALSLATVEAPLVICGSIYSMGEILRVFEKA
jgi:dihydrofolate synthase/folylpolyglutamate synthase